MTQATADFETGVNGATIATSDAGSANAWDVVSIGAGTITYDNAHSYGSLAALFAGASASKFLALTTSFADTSDHYGRFYLYITANPAAHVVIFTAQSSFGVSNAAAIDLNTDGTLRLMDSTGAVRATSSNSVALNQWVRVEYHVIHSTTVGQVEVKLFNSPNSTTPTETLATTAAWNTAASADSVMFGQVQPATAGENLWLDNIVAGATSWPGPSTRSYAYSSAVLADSPWLYWRLDDTVGTTAGDYSGNGRTGTYSGGPTLAQSGLVTDGTSVLFDATNDYCLSSSAVFNSSDCTVEVWFEYDGTPASSVYLTIAGCVEGDGGGVTDKLIQIDTSGHAIFYVYDGAAKRAVGATVLTPGVCHLVGTVAGGTATIYVNGVSDGTIAASGSFTGYGAPNCIVAGNTSVWERKAGRRDEFALYTSALSAARVLAHYNAGIASAAAQVLVPQLSGRGAW